MPDEHPVEPDEPGDDDDTKAKIDHLGAEIDKLEEEALPVRPKPPSVGAMF